MNTTQSEHTYTYTQTNRHTSPRPPSELLRQLAFEWTWFFLCQWTPKPCNIWRLFILRLFGARIFGRPFVHQRARIEVPWNLIMRNGSCLGDRAHAYSLGVIELKEGCDVSQECYLCTGTHQLDDPALPLTVAKITIGPEAFLGARSFVLPGVKVGEGAVIGACSVVTKDMPDWTVCVGNPCRPIAQRKISKPFLEHDRL